MAKLSHSYVKECYKMIDEYKSGKRFNDKINMQIKDAIASADIVDFRIEEIWFEIVTKLQIILKICNTI